ncbi:hydroxyacid dehydrogenase [Chenggangzhangella methanolivorans]|uniref:Hydroxyacid dehydrogenase n=1 Tax=Chenggangzhangella methanolivorans TaxID=1437009 RepID=A0A9E6ULU6_9HYPH|nr:hydroxyacid dehydrogenase [Chenggangzhangella methanolivorans]QZO00947.1 hydroxyacid dehydrogenase [Chenggangzhangella methanolivorans]
MPKIVISEFIDEAAIAEHLGAFEVVYDPDLVDQPERLAKEAGNADALIVRNRTQVRGALLEGATKLICVGRLGVGLDNIDVDACKARNVDVFPATGANDVSVAEYVIGTAMVLLRGAYVSTPEMAQGAWPRNALSAGREISGKRLGLVGYGSIARETARRAIALGMSVVGHDPYVPADSPAWGQTIPMSLPELLKTSDVVSLHVPLTDGTRGLIGAGALASMKRDAILINAARGGVVDEAAVASALKERRLGGAALDVFDAEPLRGAAAEIFAGVPNLILTPHVAGVTAESNVRVSGVTAASVAKRLTGA